MRKNKDPDGKQAADSKKEPAAGLFWCQKTIKGNNL